MIKEKKELLSELVKSYKKCLELGIPHSLSRPIIFLDEESLLKKLEENAYLIESYKSNIKNLARRLKKYIFLLTDKEGYLLELISQNSHLRSLIKKREIKPGLFFGEESCGVNAIYLALKLKKKYYSEKKNTFVNYSKIGIALLFLLKREESS